MSTIFTAPLDLRYEGDNYDKHENLCGFFRATLTSVDNGASQFHYSNRKSQTEFLTEGEVIMKARSLQNGTWQSFVATVHDFDKKAATTYRGRRATTTESAIMHGTDVRTLQKLVRRVVAEFEGEN